ncbi:MAG: hypothetical protein VZR33_02495 [Methanosphaera sp.]|nr:hypothetical protein [Methanosphaera sp.]
MNFGIDIKDGEIKIHRSWEKVINQNDADVIKEIIKHLDYDETGFRIVANSSNYTTLYYKLYEIFRLKSGSRSQWLSLNMDGLDRDESNPIFDLQKNKNQLFWKSDLRNLDELIPLINQSIEYHIKK